MTGHNHRTLTRAEYAKQEERRGMEAALARITSSITVPEKTSIELLLRAIATRQTAGSPEKNAQLVNNRIADITIALDMIASWIGRTEKRLDSHFRNAPPAAGALAAIAEHVETLSHKISVLPSVSANTIAAITDISLELEQLQAELARKAPQTAVAAIAAEACKQNEMISRVSSGLVLLEMRLSKLERKNAQPEKSLLVTHVSALVRHLDGQSRIAARNTRSTISYFDLVTEKLESLGKEIRHIKREHLKTVAQIVPALEKIPHQPEPGATGGGNLRDRMDILAAEVAGLRSDTELLRNEKSSLSSQIEMLKGGLEPKADRESQPFPSVSQQLQAAVLSMHATSGDQHWHAAPHGEKASSPIAAEVDGNTPEQGGLQIRAGLIAAARRAMRTGHAEKEDSDGAPVSSAEEARLSPTRGFLRTAP